ncbi:MAG: HEAT repeat domain-containing protein [Thermodesulfobacteriota bacterium]
MRARFGAVLAALWLAAVPCVRAAVVSGVSMAEREGVVEVAYDLSAEVPCEVALVGSEDAGATFALRLKGAEGDVGPAVAPGRGKKILWRIAVDYPEGLGDREVVLDIVAREPDIEFTAEDEVTASCLDRAFTRECAAAVEALGRRHPWVLRDALAHPDPRVRAGAAELLGRLGHREAVPELLGLLEDTPLPEGDNTITVREKRRVQVTRVRVRERYATVRNR